MRRLERLGVIFVVVVAVVSIVYLLVFWKTTQHESLKTNSLACVKNHSENPKMPPPPTESEMINQAYEILRNYYEADEIYDDTLRRVMREKERVFRVLKPMGKNNKSCNHTYRDFNEEPIRTSEGIRGYTNDPFLASCPVKCIFPRFDYDVGKEGILKRQPNRTCAYLFEGTMENGGKALRRIRENKVEMTGSTSFSTDAPLQYFSWQMFDFMKPLEHTWEEKNKTGAMMAAFISNCTPKKRLKILSELQEFGVTVHSYGKCLHNKDERKEDGRDQRKRDLMGEYLFIYAAENSETDDYVTEKLFGPMERGSIPVYLGASNAWEYSPAEKSVIFVNDFNTTKDLANFLKDLASNRDKYNEYFAWKEEGVSKYFKDMMDFPMVHSRCRICMRTADFIRVHHGNNVGHEPLVLDNTKNNVRYFGVRLRNTFYMSYVYIEQSELNLRNLIEAIKVKLDLIEIYKVYFLWDRMEIPISEEEVMELEDGVELEVVSLVHNEFKRFGLWEWEQSRMGKVSTEFLMHHLKKLVQRTIQP